MSNKYATHLAVCVATIAFALAYAVPAFIPVPLPWYHPAERAWTFGVHASGIAMDFYGRCLFAAVVSSLAAALMYVFIRCLPEREPSSRIVALLTFWAIGLPILVIAFYTWRLR
jgi:hypothetical protein